MTARATQNATAAVPMVESGSVRPLLEALERLGYDRRGMLAASGLDPEQLSDPDALVPCTCLGDVLALVQRERPRRNLALHVASATPIGAFPLIDYLVLSSATVGEGLARLAQYYRMFGEKAALELSETDDGMRVRTAPGGGPFLTEYGIALPLLHLRRESAGHVSAVYVSFEHSPDDAAAYESTLGCPVRVHAAWSGFVLSRETWALPMRRRDPVLLAVLERQADARMARLPPAEDLVAHVRRAVTTGLADGRASMTEIARQLAMAPRTLQRRLSDEATTFQQVVEEVRRDAAERHLGESALSIAEISFALGYSEPAAFHRAFRRWKRTTPQAYRATRRR